MSEPGSRNHHGATIVEVFPMRLGGETLTDVTLRPEVEDGFPDPKPDDALHLPDGVELVVWAAPKIAHPKGSLQFNVQFQAEALTDVELEEGMVVSLESR
ncbi:MAG: hypothetical protein ABFS86_04265 [Planctomycetota bacterium]